MERWHCIQVGDQESFDGPGSSVWREARKMATREHRDNPDEEIRIVTVLCNDFGVVQEIVNTEVIYKGDTNMEAGIRSAMWSFFNNL